VEKDHAGNFGLRGIVIGWKENLHLPLDTCGGFVDVGFSLRTLERRGESRDTEEEGKEELFHGIW
jgi:hypothetical protein